MIQGRMLSGVRYSSNTFKPISTCSLTEKKVYSFSNNIFHQQDQRRYSHTKQTKELSTQLFQENLVQAFYQNVSWVNRKYEDFFGITQIRQIQEKVLRAEGDFVIITQSRKQCQEEIDKLKDTAEKLRYKLESTPRSSDRYLELITEEHDVLKNQTKLKTELDHLKEKEQFNFDRLSKLLRQSHETERLRQEKSRYGNLISVFLSISGTTITLLAYKLKNEKPSEKEKSILLISQKLESLDANLVELVSDFKGLKSLLKQLEQSKTASIKKEQVNSWTYYVPGLGSLKTLLGYLWWW